MTPRSKLQITKSSNLQTRGSNKKARSGAFCILGFLLAFLSAPEIKAATEPAPLPRMAARTNVTAKTAVMAGKTNALAAGKQSSKTNAASGSQTLLSRTKAQTVDSFHRLQGTRAFYPVIIGVPVCLILAGMFFVKSIKSRSRRAKAAASELQAPSLASRPTKRPARTLSKSANSK